MRHSGKKQSVLLLTVIHQQRLRISLFVALHLPLTSYVIICGFGARLLVQNPFLAGLPIDLKSNDDTQNNINEKKKPSLQDRTLLDTLHKEMWMCKHVHVYIHIWIHIFYMCTSLFLHWVPTYRKNYTHVIEGIIKESICREEMSIWRTSAIWNWSQVILRRSIYYSVLLALTYIYNLSST